MSRARPTRRAIGKYSGNDKYEGAYEDMGQFIQHTPSCIPAEADRLLRRILACLLVGNTDAHFKNFAMFHTRDGLRLTPAYDVVAASVYSEYQTIALRVGRARDIAIGALKPKHLLELQCPAARTALRSPLRWWRRWLPVAIFDFIEGSTT